MRQMTDQLLAENQSTTFNCLINESHFMGGLRKNRLTIEWFHNGFPIVPILMSRKDRHRFKILNTE